MLTSKYMRIVSILGIIALLSLQYVWLRNAYQMVEREIMVNSKECLKEATSENMIGRFSNANIKVRMSDKMNIQPGCKILGKGEINQVGDFNSSLEELLTIIHRPCHINDVSILFKKKINQQLGFVPKYTLQIISNKARYQMIKNSIQTNRTGNFSIKLDSIYKNDSIKVYDIILGNSIFLKMDKNRSFLLTMDSPNKTIIRKAKYILLSSLLLVILIGVILLFQLKSMIKDKEFTKFMKDYTRILAHEFRTPINDIYLLTSSFMNNKDLSLEKIALYNQEKLNQCSKMLLGIDNLLLLAKSEQTKLAAHKTLTDMRLFINKIADKYRNNSFMRKNLKLETSFTPEDCQAYIDPDLMENVLVNLVENAIKYSNEDTEVSISCAIEDKHLILKIKDNGFGISESDQKHIFQIFERGKKVSGNQIKGFGIGLYYVSLVIKAHQGKVEVLSEEGKGSEFVITIPNRFL